jgi:transcription elongation factor SPT5
LTSAKTTHRRHLDLDRRRREMEGMDDEQVAAFYAEKYGGRSKGQSFKDTEEVPQQLLLPSVNDPNLWMVKCKPGKEKDVIFGLMKRYFDRRNGANSLDTFSAFARETLKGYIYIEASRQAHVQEALNNIPNVYMSTLTLVPINDMVDSITVHKKVTEIPLGGWVRVKRGNYAGDLAQVIELPDSQDSARIKLVPRLDLGTDDDLQKTKKKGARPPPKLFNPERLGNRSISSLQKKGPYWVFNGDHFRDGYLEKYIKVAMLQVEDVNPTLDEIARFAGSGDLNGEDGDRSLDLTSLSSLALNNATASTLFQPGDVVSVIEGDMIHSWGTVENVLDSSVVVSLDMDGSKKQVTLPVKHLRKKFKEGDHVKVINGRYKDESGMVVNIKDSIVTLISDASLNEVQVFAKDLREAAEVMFGKTVIGNYELHDLVQLE